MRQIACEIGVAKEMDEEEEIFRLPHASQITSPLFPRKWRGVGTAGLLRDYYLSTCVSAHS
jgi:hypothetical protein